MPIRGKENKNPHHTFQSSFLHPQNLVIDDWTAMTVAIDDERKERARRAKAEVGLWSGKEISFAHLKLKQFGIKPDLFSDPRYGDRGTAVHAMVNFAINETMKRNNISESNLRDQIAIGADMRELLKLPPDLYMFGNTLTLDPMEIADLAMRVTATLFSLFEPKSLGWPLKFEESVIVPVRSPVGTPAGALSFRVDCRLKKHFERGYRAVNFKTGQSEFDEKELEIEIGGQEIALAGLKDKRTEKRCYFRDGKRIYYGVNISNKFLDELHLENHAKGCLIFPWGTQGEGYRLPEHGNQVKSLFQEAALNEMHAAWN